MMDLNVGSLNCRGLTKPYEEETLADDMRRYQIHLLAIQETHLKGTGTKLLTTTDSKAKYRLFYTGSQENKFHGVGIVISDHLNAQFKEISNRICTATVKLDGRKLHFICAYAPTLKHSEKNPEIRTKFYEQLDSITTSISNRDIIILAWDFNAKTGSSHENYPSIVGRYGKGETNSNGEFLIEFALLLLLHIESTKH